MGSCSWGSSVPTTHASQFRPRTPRARLDRLAKRTDRAFDDLAVHEEGRGAADAQLLAAVVLGEDGFALDVRFLASIKERHVETELLAPVPDALPAQLILMNVIDIHELPELALIGRALTRLCRRHRVLVERGERELMELKANLRPVFLKDRLHDVRVGTPARRTLQIAILIDAHDGIGVALRIHGFARIGTEPGRIDAGGKDENGTEEDEALHGKNGMNDCS